MTRYFAAVLACALLWTTSCLAEPAIWQVKGKHNTLYLLGTIHLLPADEQLSANVQRAYQHAGHLLMEINMSEVEPLATQTMLLQLGMLPTGKTLNSQLDGGTQRKLQVASSALGIDSEMLAQFQPWLAALTLEQLQYAKLGFAAESGVEMQLMQRAAQDHKAIAGLETMEQQLNLFADMDMPTQRLYLKQTLDELDESPKELQQLLQAWRNGDTRQLQVLTQQGFDTNPALKARLLTQRNQRWVTLLKPLLDQQSDDYLVAVGAMHLIGDDGLVALLQRAGYQVTLQ